MANENYNRVFPRDFFNESKLLKCLGRLSLLVHDRLAPKEITMEHIITDSQQGIEIGLMDDGHLRANNIVIAINGAPAIFKTVYNSKARYPFYLDYEYCEYPVFDDNGDFTEEFIEKIKDISNDS